MDDRELGENEPKAKFEPSRSHVGAVGEVFMSLQTDEKRIIISNQSLCDWLQEIRNCVHENHCMMARKQAINLQSKLVTRSGRVAPDNTTGGL